MIDKLIHAHHKTEFSSRLEFILMTQYYWGKYLLCLDNYIIYITPKNLIITVYRKKLKANVQEMLTPLGRES